MNKLKKRILPMVLMVAMVLAMLPALTVSAAAGGIPLPDGMTLPSGSFTQSAGVNFLEEFTMVRVEGGSFTLGWEGTPGEGPDDTAPIANVSVSSFYIGQTVVTNALWNAVMGTGPNNQNPRTGVNWYEVQHFLGRLYALTGYVFRLPTETEWEYAAKGGVNWNQPAPDYPGYNHGQLRFAGSNVMSRVARTGPQGPVGSLAPNVLGIFDMSGSVEEWVWDAWNAGRPNILPFDSNPTNPTSGDEGHRHNQKTRRGGSNDAGLSDFTRYLTGRQIRSIDGSDGGLGFRIALSVDRTSVPETIRGGMPISRMEYPWLIRGPVMYCPEYPVTHRDFRWATDFSQEHWDEWYSEVISQLGIPGANARLYNHVWAGDFIGFGRSVMRIWSTGEMLIHRFDAFGGTFLETLYGQWYTVSNVGLIFINEADGSRITLPYIAMAPGLMMVVNDQPGLFASPYGSKALMGLEEVPDDWWGAAGAPSMDQPTIVNLVPDWNDLAPSDVPGAMIPMIHTNVIWADIDWTNPATFQNYVDLGVIGQDERLIDGDDYSWYMGSNMAGGEHGYRKDFNAGGQAHFHVFTPPPGWNNTLARGSWVTVNDIFVRIFNADNTMAYELVYAMTPDAHVVGPGGTGEAWALRHITFESIGRGDQRAFTLTPNGLTFPGQAMIPGTNIPTPRAQPYDPVTAAPTIMDASTFRQAPPPPIMCPGLPGAGPCGDIIYECSCRTMCQSCERHVNNCGCDEMTRAWLAVQNVRLGLNPAAGLTAAGILSEIQDVFAAADPPILVIPSWHEAFDSDTLSGIILLTLGADTEYVVFSVAGLAGPVVWWFPGYMGQSFSLGAAPLPPGDPFLATINIPDGALVFGLFSGAFPNLTPFDPPDEITGVLRVNSIDDLVPGTWFATTGGAFNYVILMPNVWSWPDAMHAVPNRAGAPWPFEAPMTPGLETLLGVLPDGALIWELFDRVNPGFLPIPGPTEITGFTRVASPAEIVPGTWYSEFDLDGQGFGFLMLMPPTQQGLWTVTFNAHGGTPAPSQITGVEHNTTITLPTPPTRGQDEFLGWFTAATGGTEFTAATPVTGNTTLHAQWRVEAPTFFVTPGETVGGEPLVITITGLLDHWFFSPAFVVEWPPGSGTMIDIAAQNVLFIDTGGTISFNRETTLSRGGAPVPGSPFAADYVINMNAAMSNISVTLDDGTFVTFLYAPNPGPEWAGTVPNLPHNDFPGIIRPHFPSPYTWRVTFQLAGGTHVSGQLVQILLTGGNASLPVVTPPVGFTFGGWYPAGSYNNVTADITITAVWNAIPQLDTWTVTFNTHGGTAVAPITGVTDGTTITLPEAPTRGQDTFLGWFTAATGGVAFTANTPVTADITVYAQWYVATQLPQPPIGPGVTLPPPLPPQPPAPPTPPTPPQPPLPDDDDLPPAFPFVDVAAAAWYRDYVQTVWENALFQGTAANLFSTQANMTRAMFAQALANLEGVDLTAYADRSPTFGDVAPGAWYFPAVEWAAQVGVVLGVGEGNFAPSRPITREQKAVMIYRHTEIMGISLPQGEAVDFADQYAVSYWAVDAVHAIKAAGIITGHPDGRFAPMDTATRAQVAAVFARLWQHV
ncbi:MAG: InlB B-repeat-containing protein [Oscillospiraceae bacterium]|nr:InlB B-repeat-containing protein [Oscillospiraceae bacterium]